MNWVKAVPMTEGMAVSAWRVAVGGGGGEGGSGKLPIRRN